jgi:hypothetical protein
MNKDLKILQIKENDDDIHAIQSELRIDTLTREVAERKRMNRKSWIATVTLFALLLASIIGCFYFVSKAQKDASEMIENNRMSLVQGMYSVSRTSAEEMVSRNRRIDNYFRNAKKIILTRNPKTDLKDSELNEFLRVNWELSEVYMWSPYISLAYAAVESDFTKKAISVCGCKGIFQWLPSSMHEVLGDSYTEGMEFNPIWSLKAWYKRTSINSEIMDNDFLWTACAYILPGVAISYKIQGKTVEQFMDKLVELYPRNGRGYPWEIKELYDQYSSM